MIFNLYAVVSNFHIKLAHNLIRLFPVGSSFCVASVYSHCHRKNQNRSMMILTSPVSCVSDTFLCISFLSFGFTVISIIWQIRFTQWWVWRWWVWLQVRWYVRFTFLLWWIRWLCWSLHWFCWKFHWLCLWSGVWRYCPDRNWVNCWRCSVGHVCTKRSRVQRQSTHRNILAPKSWFSLLVSKSVFKL